MRHVLAIGLGFLAALSVLPPDASAQMYKFKTLNYPKGGLTILYGVNTAGEIVGDFGQFEQQQCFTVTGKTKTLISDPEGAYTTCYDINNSSVVTGTYEDSQGLITGFMYDGSAFTTVSVPGATETFPQGISDDGVVIGFYYPGNGSPQAGFLFDSKTAIYSSFTIRAAVATSGMSVNDSGVYTIQATEFGKTSSYYSDGKHNKQVKFPGATATYVKHINNAGQIAASWVDAAGNYHGGVYDTVAGTYTTIDDPGMADTYGEGISDKQRLVGTFMTTASAQNEGYVAKEHLK